MKNGMRFLCLFLTVIVFVFSPAAAEENVPSVLEINAKSAVLMDFMTGDILFSHNPKEHLQIASVTKIMTMLLIMEAINAGKISYEDMVTTSEYAASMGGSQVYLEQGEQMTVSDMLKAIAVASANDACVAMAEHIMGSVPAFINAMNKRAKALEMNDTVFVNCSGLDDENQYSCASDVAKMTKELLKHQAIIPYLTIWIDSLRNGEFGLSNTNRLIRFYDGAIGVKTGSTDEAKYCLSAAATRDDLTLIAVVLAAPTTNDRFSCATKLLDYGFANYAMIKGANKGDSYGNAAVSKGEKKEVEAIAAEDFRKLVSKEEKGSVDVKVVMPEYVIAPVNQNEKIGELHIYISEKHAGTVDLVAKDHVPRIKVWYMFINILKMWSVMC
jgi:D-alanyl-D-alanine carboxypeptidase (penicillin-binding protein 5/6)